MSKKIWCVKIKDEYVKEFNLNFNGYVLDGTNPFKKMDKIYFELKEKYFPDRDIHDLLHYGFATEEPEEKDYSYKRR